MLKQQVFLSYRHESLEHARDVRRLGELLKQAKLPVVLDQFLLEDQPGGPDDGWPKWCEDCANQSACVVIIASEGWFAAYDKTAPAYEGYGAASEADLFRQALWDDKGQNERLRVAHLHKVNPEKVPKRLRAWHHFRPFETSDQLDQLIRWIGQRLGLKDVASPTVQWPNAVPFEPDIADRVDKEWRAVGDLLTGKSQKRILLFEGASGVGKSEVLNQTVDFARKLEVPVARINLKGGTMGVPEILGQLLLDLGEYLPDFSADLGSKAHLLRLDLRKLRRPVLVIVDSFEDATGKPGVVDWVNHQLLSEVQTSLALAVIVSGQKVPDQDRATWQNLAQHIVMNPINQVKDWEPWVNRKFPGLLDRGVHLPTILLVAQGNPAVVATACRAISGSAP